MPRLFNANAVFTDTVDFPTPPFADEINIMFDTLGIFCRIGKPFDAFGIEFGLPANLGIPNGFS